MDKSSNSLARFLRFLLLAFGITWLFWISAALLQQNVLTFPTILLHTLGGFGPSIAGVWMIYRSEEKAGRRDFWQRVFSFRLVGAGWTIFILALFPLVAFASIQLSFLAGGPAHPYTGILLLAAQPVLLITMLLYGIIAGPISEELGWRGFALDALLARWNPLLASAVLGIAWGVWHLPLFFIAGTPQQALGIGTLAFWQFQITPLPLSALMTWVYLRTGRSILSAILMHLGFNVTANLFYPLSAQATIIHLVLMVVLAAATLLHIRKGKKILAA